MKSGVLFSGRCFFCTKLGSWQLLVPQAQAAHKQRAVEYGAPWGFELKAPAIPKQRGDLRALHSELG